MGVKLAFAFFALPLVALLLAGCCCCIPPIPDNDTTPTPGGFWPPSGQAKWTYLVYMDGDNNLEEAALYDFLEMEQVGSTQDVYIVVQMDRSSGYYDGEGDWSGARRFYVQPGDGNSISSPMVQDLGEVDMASQDTLYDFVSWGMDNYPAQKYAVVLWNHGGGWTGLLQDEGSGNGMFLPELRQALSRMKDKLGRKIDVVVFDMCLMAQYDVVLDVAPYADYMVASEETVPGWSFDYTEVARAITANPDMSSRELAVMEVQKFREYYISKDDATTMSALDLSRAPALESAYYDFASALTAHVAAGKWKEVAEMHMYTEGYPVGMGAEQARAFSFGDLYDFASNAEAYSASNSDLGVKAAALQSAVNQTVIANYNHPKHPRSSGISYYFQPSKRIYDSMLTSEYQRTTAYNAQQWKGFLSAYYARAPETVESPRVGDFRVSRSASLARPVRFSYSISGQNIVSNNWAQFYQEGGNWKLARLVHQRTSTTLPNGKVVYGFPGGTGQGEGRSSAVEAFITDGSQQVRASVEQLWPEENFYAVDGSLRKTSGEQSNARLYFYDANGSLARIQLIQQGANGQTVISYLLGLDNGDQFSPYVYLLSTNGLSAAPSGSTLTYNSAHGFSLSWRPLSAGQYLVANILGDLANQTGYTAGALTVSTQPTLTPLQQSDLRNAWECGQIEDGMRVQRLFLLNLTNSDCVFEDVTGSAACTLTYSQESAPQVYISVPERFETYKFLASRVSSSAFWLFSTAAGEDPIYCVTTGSGRPSIQVYRDLYASVGDSGADLEAQDSSPACLQGEWESERGNMTLGFWSGYHGNEVTWRLGSHEIIGSYSINGSILSVNSTYPTPDYSTQFYYLCNSQRLVLYDMANQQIVFNKPGHPLPSVSNDPVPAVQPGGVQPQPTPQVLPTPNVPTGLAGTWYNPAAPTTLMLDPYGFYTLLDGYYYYYGVYSVEGNTLNLNYAGTTVKYYYQLSGNQLTLTGNGVTITLARIA